MSLPTEVLETLQSLSLTYINYVHYVAQITYIGILLTWISAAAFRTWKGAIIALIFSIYMPYSLSQIKNTSENILLDLQEGAGILSTFKIEKIEQAHPWYMAEGEEVFFIYTGGKKYQFWSKENNYSWKAGDSIEGYILPQSQIILTLQ